MKGIIKINRFVLKDIIMQSLKKANLERCGYLMGSKIINEDEILIIINGVYHDPRYYSEDACNFSILRLYEAKSYAESLGLTVVGNYHSHGNYPAIFSLCDREMQMNFNNNECTLIYSPFENKLIGDIVTTDNNVIPSRITFFGDKNIYNQYVDVGNAIKR